MTRTRTSLLLVMALTGALALSSCQKNPEATEARAPAASTEQTGTESANAPATGASTEPGPAGISNTLPPAESTPPAETPPAQTTPVDK